MPPALDRAAAPSRAAAAPVGRSADAPAFVRQHQADPAGHRRAGRPRWRACWRSPTARRRSRPDFLAELVLYALSATDLTILVALVFVLARNIVKLVVERRRALPFARFRAKLVAALLGMTFIPAVLVLARRQRARFATASTAGSTRRWTQVLAVGAAASPPTTTRNSSASSSSFSARLARRLRAPTSTSRPPIRAVVQAAVRPTSRRTSVELVEVFGVARRRQPPRAAGGARAGRGGIAAGTAMRRSAGRWPSAPRRRAPKPRAVDRLGERRAS